MTSTVRRSRDITGRIPIKEHYWLLIYEQYWLLIYEQYWRQI